MTCLQRVDNLLAGRRFILNGDQPTACDHQLMAYANWCALDGISVAHMPDFERWCQQMLLRPSVQQALTTIGSPLSK